LYCTAVTGLKKFPFVTNIPKHGADWKCL